MAKGAVVKAKAKTLHGENASQREISVACKISRTVVLKWVTEWEADGFPKGYLQAALDQKQAESREKEREKLGLTAAKVDAKILKLMDAKKSIYFEGQKVDTTEDNPTQLGATSLAAEVLGMKKGEGEKALEAGVFAFYRAQLAANRGKA